MSDFSGHWRPSHLAQLYYGSSSVSKHLSPCLPSPSSKAFIVTGSSLANKTSLIQDVERLLGQEHHAGTYTKIAAHAPVAQLDEATALVAKDASIDTIISVGGGSPIDSAKAISHRQHERTGTWLHHIAIPTTLSAAECTSLGGYTNSSGVKVGVTDPQLMPKAIIYDARFAVATPPRLFTSTGLRALDHAVEFLYHPDVSEVPGRALGLFAIESLFTALPLYHADPKNEEVITRLQLAAFASLISMGTGLSKGLGLSHALGHALGATYGIPHGITSCITLPGVIRYKAEADQGAATQLARALPRTGSRASVASEGDPQEDARRSTLLLADAVEALIKRLGLETRLGEYGVGEDQVGVIAKRATGKDERMEGELWERAAEIIRSKL